MKQLSQSKLKSKKGLIIGTTIGVVALLGTTPSYAFSLDVNGFFNQIVGELNGYFEQTKGELTAKINESWGGLKGEAKTATVTGAMDMPDPVAILQTGKI